MNNCVLTFPLIRVQ